MCFVCEKRTVGAVESEREIVDELLEVAELELAVIVGPIADVGPEAVPLKSVLQRVPPVVVADIVCRLRAVSGQDLRHVIRQSESDIPGWRQKL